MAEKLQKCMRDDPAQMNSQLEKILKEAKSDLEKIETKK